MRSFILVVMLTFSGAAAAANTTGKSLDQFFVMASDFFQKAVIVDPDVDGRIRVYGVDKSEGFKEVFYSLLKAHDLDYQETDSLIRVRPKQKQSAKSVSVESNAIQDYVISTIRNVYITGSLTVKRDGQVIHDYSFAQSDTRKIFKPENVGLDVVGLRPCKAFLTYRGFKSLVTCEPYLPERQVTSEERTAMQQEIELALSERREQRGQRDTREKAN